MIQTAMRFERDDACRFASAPTVAPLAAGTA